MEEVDHDTLVSCLCSLHSCPTLRLHDELLCSLLLSANGAGRDGVKDGVRRDGGRVEDGRSGFVRVRNEPLGSFSWHFDGVEEG